MKLANLAAKPQLVRVVITDEDVVKQYGDELEFWVYDRQDMETFIKLATLDNTNFQEVAEIVKKMILDESGQPVIHDGFVLPIDIMMKAIQKVVDTLGKPMTTTSAAPVGS